MPRPVPALSPLARATSVAALLAGLLGQLAASSVLVDAEFALANQASHALTQLKKLLLDRLEAQDGDATAAATRGGTDLEDQFAAVLNEAHPLAVIAAGHVRSSPALVDSPLGLPLEGIAAPVATLESVLTARTRRSIIDTGTLLTLTLPALQGTNHDAALAALELLQGIARRLGAS